MKKYDIYYAGGEKITTIYSTCISRACKSFIETLSKPDKYTINSKELADVRKHWLHEIKWNQVVLVRELNQIPDMTKIEATKAAIESILKAYTKK